MCTTHVYSYVHADGHKETIKQPTLCPNSYRGKPCANNVVFQLPSQHVGASSAPVTSYMGSQLPPTPTYTPPSSTANYRSGDESDRSYRSGSSSRSKKRSSGIYVSVNGQPIVDVNRRDRRNSERIVLVDSPPTPRTPPQTFTGPRTAPPSPSMPFIVDAPRESSSRRPVIVDERPRVTIELTEPQSSRGHARHSSTSSRDSHRSRRSSHTDDEERQLRRERREQRHEERRLEEMELREQKLRARIAKANYEIANRPAAPMPPAPPRRSATISRPVVEIPAANEDAELVEAMRRLRVEKEARRIAEQQEREEEAQRQRLLERMKPKRRATVGPGSRRTRVLYDDGIYRWE